MALDWTSQRACPAPGGNLRGRSPSQRGSAWLSWGSAGLPEAGLPSPLPSPQGSLPEPSVPSPSQSKDYLQRFVWECPYLFPIVSGRAGQSNLPLQPEQLKVTLRPEKNNNCYLYSTSYVRYPQHSHRRYVLSPTLFWR